MAKGQHESKKARDSRAQENKIRQALAKRYASRKSLGGTQGPLVATVLMRNSGIEYLIRRLDLLELLTSGVWPKPITQEVRQMMIDGASNRLTRSQRPQDYYGTALALIRRAVIAPPQEVFDGTLLPEDITSEQCKPLYVGSDEDPDDDQLILMPWDKYVEKYHDQIATLRQKVRSGDYADSTVRKYEREVEKLEEEASSKATIHYEDAIVLANEILNLSGGTHRRFRNVTADVVGALAELGVDVDEAQPDDPAAAGA